jgi:hypothetical protein
MSLEVAQFATIPQDMWGKIESASLVPWGPPASVDTIENAASVTISGAAATPRLVRILAKGADQKIMWPSGVAETIKAGVPELRIMTAGTVLTCQAA